jgi:hypothetical protein
MNKAGSNSGGPVKSYCTVFLLEPMQLFIYPGEFNFTVVQCMGLRREHRSWEKISSLVAAMGSAGASRNGSPRAFRTLSLKECWSNCPQRLLMLSAFLAVLVVSSWGRVVVIPCEVHVGTSAWYQNNRWSHSAELGISEFRIHKSGNLQSGFRKGGVLGHQRGTKTVAGVLLLN